MRIHPKRKQIIAAIIAGKSYEFIQNTYKCSNVMITYRKRLLGLPIKKADKSPAVDKKIVNLLKQGKTYMHIIRTLKTHSQRILKVKNEMLKLKSIKDEFGGMY